MAIPTVPFKRFQERPLLDQSKLLLGDSCGLYLRYRGSDITVPVPGYMEGFDHAQIMLSIQSYLSAPFGGCPQVNDHTEFLCTEHSWSHGQDASI